MKKVGMEVQEARKTQSGRSKKLKGTLCAEDQVTVNVGSATAQRSRRVELAYGEVTLRDEINTNSLQCRKRLITEFARRLGVDPEILVDLDRRIVVEADRIDDLEWQADDAYDDESDENEPHRQPQATQILKAFPPHRLFRTPDGKPFISVDVDGHSENLEVDSGTCKMLVAKIGYDVLGCVPSASTTSEVVRTLQGQALFDGQEREVALRIAGDSGGVYVDLGTDSWEAVHISAEGWRIIPDSPVAFWRAPGMKALPRPVAGGNIDELRGFVNLATDDDFVLLVGLLVGSYSPTGPYAVGALYGPQGSSKSTLTRLVRDLVDPNSDPIRSVLRNEENLMIAAANSRMVCFDNVSQLKTALSDSLCRLATGGGFSTRKRFTNTEEVLISLARPVVMNGIDEFATRPDLLSRSIVLQVPEISDGERRLERDFWPAFNQAKPRILGAIYSAVAAALRNLEAVRDRHNWPRMADVCGWLTAAESAFGWSEGTFLRAFEANQLQAKVAILEHSPVVDPLRCVLRESRGQWSGTARELLAGLELHAGRVSRRSGWPRSPSALSRQLHRFQSNLREIGVDIEFQRGSSSRRERLIDIRGCREVALRAAG